MNFFLPSLFCLAAFATFGFIISRISKRNDIADILWGLGFILIAIVNTSSVALLSFRAKIVLAFTILWGMRLFFHIGKRSLEKTEDQRYANWRKEWGKSEPIRAFFQIYLLQSCILGVVSLPILWVIRMPGGPLSVLDFLGTGLFLFGFLLETFSDWQLTQFKSNRENKGKLLTTGLWKYSRHPNYLGEILIWWGIFAFALNTQKGLITLLSPCLITFLLLKVSGVPMLEKLLSEKGEAFDQYSKGVPALFPIHFKFILTFIVILSTLVFLGLQKLL